MKQLAVGRGEFFLVKIEALADPTPPVFDEEALRECQREDLRELVGQLDGLSERESMDQVHRNLTLYLCNACYRTWIENPAS